jgi:tRNA nucleotidyltransferase (CCA-adding enzyme)
LPEQELERPEKANRLTMPNETIDFLAPEITQGDLVTFADEKVNLKQEHAQRYREQVSYLRDHLDRYISEHPDIGLVKMLLSGSLAKGTALRTINDVDVAMYVKGEGAPQELAKLLEWLVEKLRNTFPQILSQNIRIDGPCVVISFQGTGIDVDVAPILYEGDPEWRGYLWDRMTGKRTLTSIPLHLEFIRKRKESQPTHFAQVIRLLKWWVDQRRQDTPGFDFRSFLVELIMAKLADAGNQFDDYHEGLVYFFSYIQRTGLRDRISFSDNYPASKLPAKRVDAVEIFDPVNHENNVASDMTEAKRQQLASLADKALDALSYAKTCQTKAEALECWQELMGAGFNA